MPIQLTQTTRRLTLGLMALLLAVPALIGLSSGAVSLSATEIAQVLAAKLGLPAGTPDAVATTVIWEIRAPRLLMAMLVGAALTMAGAMLQGLFRNPLADPGLIGVSSGAAMGAVIAIVMLPRLGLTPDSVGRYGLPVLAMGGAVGVTFLIYQLSKVGGRTHVASMLLTGIAVNAIGGAFTGLAVTVFASDQQLRSVTFWTLGSLAGANWEGVGIIALIVIPSLIICLRYTKALNAFLLGEVEAWHLGVPVQSVKRAVIILSALMVGVTVAFCGIIGFVGLVVPHIIRLMFGPDHRFLLPGGALLGAAVLLMADTFARTSIAPAELSIGILTALLGGPFFLGLLLTGRKKLQLG